MLYLILLSPYLSISYIPSVPSIPDYLIHSLFFSLLQLLIYHREAYEIRQPVCMIKLYSKMVGSICWYVWGYV